MGMGMGGMGMSQGPSGFLGGAQSDSSYRGGGGGGSGSGGGFQRGNQPVFENTMKVDIQVPADKACLGLYLYSPSPPLLISSSFPLIFVLIFFFFL